jgi:hypothetical protein
MAAFLFRCPNTGLLVQGWSESEVAENGTAFEAITSLHNLRMSPNGTKRTCSNLAAFGQERTWGGAKPQLLGRD